MMHERLIGYVLEASGISREMLTGAGRSKLLNTLRQLCWLRLRNAGYPNRHIGELFGRDHSAVTQGVNTVRALLQAGDPYATAWNAEIEKYRSMSRERSILEVTPPEGFRYANRETHVFRGFECPRCSGRGKFEPVETGRGEYRDVICDACGGAGSLDAEVRIDWVPAKTVKQ
jgi:hypothetical protein